jgi:hypothetical protein
LDAVDPPGGVQIYRVNVRTDRNNISQGKKRHSFFPAFAAIIYLPGWSSPSAFGAGPQGVYYVPCDPTPDPVVHVLDPETGRDRPLGKLEKFVGHTLGLAVSPDGTIFYSRRASESGDLVLIDNFR